MKGVVALLAAPAAWAFTQGTAYAAMKPVCATMATSVLWITAAMGLTIAGAGAWVAWRRLPVLHRAAENDGARAVDVDHFTDVVALAMNALIALLILTSSIPQFLLSPCE